MYDYSPSSLFMGTLKNKLEEELGFDFYLKHPDPSILEPLGVVGNPSANNDKTAKVGRSIEDVRLQIDIYLPHNYNVLQVDTIRSKAVRILGRNNVTTDVREDDSTNRKLWRINIQLLKTI